MKVLFIANFDRKMNEGMRNIANNLANNIKSWCQVEKKTAKTYFKSLVKLNNNKYAIIHIIFRANIKGYTLGIVAKLFSCRSKVILSVVQPPSKVFLMLISIYNPFAKYYTLAQDIKKLFEQKGIPASIFQLGIDFEKFSPSLEDNRHSLYEQFGLSGDKPTILHVGHCSRGRNLEVFLQIDKLRYNRLVICSGMFSDSAMKEKLKADGVKLIEEYLPNIHVAYQLADVYVFPTQSRDFVIDLPLSVVEAFACGTPVITYRNLLEICNIPIIKQDALIVHDQAKDINQEISAAILHKSRKPFIDGTYTWKNMAISFYDEYDVLVTGV